MPPILRSSSPAKYAVVTGGTQGLGEAIARMFAARGAAGLVICGRNKAKGEAVAADLGKDGCKTHYVQADLAKVEDCRKVIASRRQGLRQAARARQLSPAITDRGTILDTSPELFDRMFAVNVRAPFFLIQDAIKIMRRESIAGTDRQPHQRCRPWRPALHHRLLRARRERSSTLTRNVAFSVMRDRIRVNGLNIGWSDTPGEDRIMKRYHGATRRLARRRPSRSSPSAA